MLSLTARPRLAPGVRLHFDKARDRWILQAPERILVLDEIAHAILSRCTGEADLAAIILDLGEAFDAEPAAITTDVSVLLGELIEKRFILT